MEEKNKIEFILNGNVPTKKNHSRIVHFGNRLAIIPSKAYRQYEKDAGWQLKGREYNINQPCNVKCVFYMGRRIKVDLPNLLNSILDVLVKFNVLSDDNRNIVYSTDGSEVLYDKENPRVEIEITARTNVSIWVSTKDRKKSGGKDE